MQVHLLQALKQNLELNPGYGFDVTGIERMEHHRLVDSVEKFRPEIVLQLVRYRVTNVFIRLAHHRLNDGRADVAGHDDHRVFEVHCAALAIGQASVVKHLQQNIENIRMRLLNLIEQQHAVGFAADSLGQITALLVAHIAWRGAYQPGHGMLFHEFTHIHANQVIFAVKHKAGQCLAELGLAHAGGA